MPESVASWAFCSFWCYKCVLFLSKQERQLGDINKQLKVKVSLEMSSVLIHLFWVLPICTLCFSIHSFNIFFSILQLEAEGQGLRALPCIWNSSGPTGNSIFPMHTSQSNAMECDHEPALQMGYVNIHPSSLTFGLLSYTGFYMINCLGWK